MADSRCQRAEGRGQRVNPLCHLAFGIWNLESAPNARQRRKGRPSTPVPRPLPASESAEGDPAITEGAGGKGPEQAKHEPTEHVGEVMDAKPDAAGGHEQG